jgi:hypothetical protein
MKHPPAMELARGDRRRESTLDERLKEVRALLAVDDAGEAAVLALDEDAGVQEYVQQEPRLTLGEAKRRDGFHPLGIGQVDCPAVGFRRQGHRIPDERVETLVRALVEHLAAFGGIPLVTVFDRPKTIALRWGRDGVVTEWNPTFAGVALDLGIGVEVCWPYRPQEKGSVENLVGWVKNSFFKQRRFLDRADLERQLHEWLTEANTVRPSRATGVPPSARIAEDRARLRPLKVAAADLALRIPVSVSPTGVVIHDGHPYSMPPDAIGLPGTLYLYRDRIRIIAGRFSADHERKFQPGDSSILPEHRAQRVAAVSGKRARRYLQRQHLIDLGAAALAYLTELTHRRPRTWIHEVERLHELLQTYGDAAVRTAFERGLADQAIGAEYIAHYLGTTIPPLPFEDEDRPSTLNASSLPRGGWVQGATGARRGAAQRSPWTRPSTAASSRRVGGRS